MRGNGLFLSCGGNMSSLFIAGNGFDLAHGIPSKYSDFRNFIIERFPEALNYRDDIIFLEDCPDIYEDEFAAEILLHTMDKICGEDWYDFEQALAKIDFNDKFPKPNHKENETEEEDNALMKDYLLYMDMLSSGYINCAKRNWQEFFRIWIKSIEESIDHQIYKAKDSLLHLFNQNDFQFITFNYTKTLQTLYGVKKVIHIHNRSGQKLIFGHGEKNVSYGVASDSSLHISSSFLDDMVNQFKKDTESPLKKYSDFFRKLDQSVNKVYSYGFSYGKVDSIYIKKIISRISPDTIWYFTEHEAQNKEMLRIKKIKLRSYGFHGNFDIFNG